ncbi:MAG TPA: CDP-alcohol phosphatidyltransferase family protein [Caldilineae bacterium]|jgi:CDP-diacylglycerol--glycerol-3-phosphate 3-phosphatidyltransferase|nr:CDP-alcohol phosphatidyltransferase family protein [Caldilineae bacterium]
MLTNLGRQLLGGVITAIANFIRWTGVSPNLITFIGFCLTAASAVFIAQGRFLIAGIVLFVAGSFDALDGALARVTGRVSRYGAFLDSTLDRYSEAICFLGLLLYYTKADRIVEVVLIYVAIIGSLLVSYTRARAEGVGVSCKVGLFTRAERWGTLVLGLLFNQVPLALWVLAIFSNITALQRIYAVWRATGGERGG